MSNIAKRISQSTLLSTSSVNGVLEYLVGVTIGYPSI